MKSSSRRFEFLLPLRFNDGQPVPDELIGEVLQGLKKQFRAMCRTLPKAASSSSI